MANEGKIVQQIIKRYGAVIDLRERPDIIIDILQRFRIELDDGGAPGGAPPGPPPGPAAFEDRVTLDDVMKEILKVSRAVAKLNQLIGPRRK